MGEIKSKVGQVFEVKIDKIIYFQKNLKEMSVSNYNKLKNSILEHGIISPGFVWRNGGKIFALDCHQRLKTLKQMRSEGITVPDKIPVVEIKAKSKKEAKRFLLQYVSQHGKIAEDGLYEFLHDAGLDTELDELQLELSLDGIDLIDFQEAYFEGVGFENEAEEKDREKDEEIDEKFTFIVNKDDATIVHAA